VARSRESIRDKSSDDDLRNGKEEVDRDVQNVDEDDGDDKEVLVSPRNIVQDVDDLMGAMDDDDDDTETRERARKNVKNIDGLMDIGNDDDSGAGRNGHLGYLGNSEAHIKPDTYSERLQNVCICDESEMSSGLFNQATSHTKDICDMIEGEART
jgi:hypothetical protein